jgi:hypothetical protein
MTGDPDNLEGLPLTKEELAENHRELMKLHPANRFRLMFGQPLLPENGLNRAGYACRGELNPETLPEH